MTKPKFPKSKNVLMTIRTDEHLRIWLDGYRFGYELGRKRATRMAIDLIKISRKKIKEEIRKKK